MDLLMVLVCISLTTSDVEHILICLLAICIFSYELLVHLLCLFFSWISVSFLSIFRDSLCNSNINSLFVFNVFFTISYLFLHFVYNNFNNLNNFKVCVVKYIFLFMPFELLEFIKVSLLFTFFCKGSYGKYVRFCGPCGLCSNYSFLPL